MLMYAEYNLTSPHIISLTELTLSYTVKQNVILVNVINTL